MNYDRRKDMTKRQYEALQRSYRTVTNMNTGTITHKTDKHPSRARQKEMDRRDMYEER